MSSLRISGLVKFADRVRRDLAHPVLAERGAQLRREVAGVLRQVECILADNQTRIEALPAPTRRAYQFLAGLNCDSVKADIAALPSQAESPPPGSVRLVGLKSHWESILHRLARAQSVGERETTFVTIRSTSEKIERHLEHGRIRSSDLTTQTRAARGWLALFAQRPQFDRYVAAVAEARAAFEGLIRGSSRFRPPALVEIRSILGLYRLHAYANATRVALPTPMICFDKLQLRQVARAALNGGDKQPIVAAMASEECQSVQAELDALSGVEEIAAGVHHDLAASFDRVNRSYFDGQLARPRLTWNRVFTGRKFGHFDPIRDTVMISCSLDHASVPEYVLDFVMYHELLHKHLGVDWRNGRAAVHTAEFREHERRFHRYGEAEVALKRLSTDAQSQGPTAACTRQNREHG